jgi:hypothetical protein
VIGKCAPRIGQIGLELDRTPQFADRLVAAAARGKRYAEFVVCKRPVRLLTREFRQCRHRALAFTARQQGLAEQECSQRMPGYDLENFGRLLDREPRLAFEQTRCVRQRRFERADRFLRRAHAVIPHHGEQGCCSRGCCWSARRQMRSAATVS